MDGNKHKNYEILNLIGYGLSKFNNSFIEGFGFSTKTAFYNFCVENNIAQTTGTIKNRMDLFDQFFPNNGRKGWWQKGDTYIHRKIQIDSLFGNENAEEYVNIVKWYMKEEFHMKNIKYEAKPIIKSKFMKLQETGLEAELYFIENYNAIDIFENGILEDARLYGDGYDFQVSVGDNSFLAEVKGIRERRGVFRLTENEYNKALEFIEKRAISHSILHQKGCSFADSFNAEILLYSQNLDFCFLKNLNAQQDIVKWINKLKSRIVMNKGDDATDEIINDFILCG